MNDFLWAAVLGMFAATYAVRASFIVFVFNIVWSWIRGPVAEANPWHSRTLEWQTTSPPPVENFPSPPVAHGHPYDYGVPGAAPHVTFFPPAVGSPAGGGGGGQ